MKPVACRYALTRLRLCGQSFAKTAFVRLCRQAGMHVNEQDRLHLPAERAAVHRMPAKTPLTARLTRMSDEARLRSR